MALTRVTPDISEESIVQSGFKNKIIGGDFSINPWQRGTSFATVAGGAYTADRFVFSKVGAGVGTIAKTLDAPTAAQAGVFTQHCLHYDVTTAQASFTSTEYQTIAQNIEGNNAVSFGFGQAGVRYVTLSFWHKHTKTGVYCVSFSNSAVNRSYVAEYNQNITDVWEKAIITIPVDTTGTWLYDTGIGLRVNFSMAAGTNFQTTPNTWAAGNYLTTINQVNALDNITNNFKIALVQLESGKKASQFETRSVGQELLLCQRYYQQESGMSSYGALGVSTDGNRHLIIALKCVMRAVPTVTSNVWSGGTPAVETNTSSMLGLTTSAGNATVGYYLSSYSVSAEF